LYTLAGEAYSSIFPKHTLNSVSVDYVLAGETLGKIHSQDITEAVTRYSRKLSHELQESELSLQTS